MVWFTAGHTIYILDIWLISNLRKVSTRISSFVGRLAIILRTFFLVGICPGTFFEFSLDAPYPSASVLELHIPRDYWVLVILFVFLVEGISSSECGYSFSIPAFKQSISSRYICVTHVAFYETHLHPPLNLPYSNLFYCLVCTTPTFAWVWYRTTTLWLWSWTSSHSLPGTDDHICGRFCKDEHQ